MQGHLSRLGATLFTLGCALGAPTEDSAMQNTTIDGATIELSAPVEVPEATIRPDSPAFDAGAAAVTVTFRNESKQPLSAPLDEIGNGLVLIYSVADREPLVDNANPPPPNDGSVITLAPGGAHVVRLSFNYPATLMPPPTREPVVVKFCVQWRQEWLRAKNYRPGTVQWNKSFDVCSDVKIRRD